MRRSFVVTGAGSGIGRAIAERLAAAGGFVVNLDLSGPGGRAPSGEVVTVVGDASNPLVADDAARRAEATAPLAGWVNNAAIFRDASLHEHPAEVLELITLNLAPVVTGSAVAVRHFLAAGHGGSIVNVSSHQAQRPVRGALPYATAKAAIEGLTRAAAVDYGHFGIRVNAVALGSIATDRHDSLLAAASPAEAEQITAVLARVHALGRIDSPREVAAVVAFLLSEASAFVTGTTLPVDGGRAALGDDPESH